MIERDYRKNRIFMEEFKKGFYKGQRENGYPMAYDLRKNLDTIKDSVINGNDDFFGVIDGPVGKGKTLNSFQIMLYLDPTFCLDRVFFNPSQLYEGVAKMTKGQGCVLDETMELNSRNAMSEWNKKINILLSQIRSKNLFIIFNLPSIFDLDRSLALYRCQLLLHCYSPSFGKKGYYGAYFHEGIKTLYILGKKYYSYRKPSPNFSGKFSNCFIFNLKEYEAKKQKGIFAGLKSSTMKGSYVERNRFIRYLRNKGMQLKEIAAIAGMEGNNIGRICSGERGQEDILYSYKEV